MEYISPISSAVMAVIWIVYFQLFLIQYQRNNRPYMVIHHAQNENPDALCLLVNMGKETIHVQCVQVVLQTRSGEERTLTLPSIAGLGQTTAMYTRFCGRGRCSQVATWCWGRSATSSWAAEVTIATVTATTCSRMLLL